ncbi:hypothetical protein Trydic_g16320 [Trypoxylus dichotomus]
MENISQLQLKKSSISRSLNLNRKATSPICLVIPFENSLEETIVEVYLTWPEKEAWPIVKIASVVIDISYHFQLYSDIQLSNFQNFLQTLIQNSYNNWDPRKESCFLKTDCTAHAKTTSGFGNAIDVELDKYFLAEFIQETYEIKKEVGKNIKVLLNNIENNSKNIDVLMHTYRELSNIVI